MGTTLNKLEYLDKTKGQIKTALNQFGSGITDNDTFRSYVNKIEDIYTNWEKVTGEGTDVTLNNTKASKMILNPKGNITQDGEPSPNNEIPVKVVDGEYEVTVSNSDNTQSQTETIDTSPNPLYSQDDYYYKDNGEWYVHNEWGKVVSNGTTIKFTGKSGATANNVFVGIFAQDIRVPSNNRQDILIKSEYFPHTSVDYIILNNAYGIGCKTDKAIAIGFTLESGIDTVDKANNWLSTHNTEVYYPLATPTNTKITNTTLINSLEALQNMKAYQDQTNISQTHNTTQADTIISASALKKGGN